MKIVFLNKIRIFINKANRMTLKFATVVTKLWHRDEIRRFDGSGYTYHGGYTYRAGCKTLINGLNHFAEKIFFVKLFKFNIFFAIVGYNGRGFFQSGI